MTTIKKALIADASLLSELAREIYREHYLHLWHPGGATWYMEEYAYSPDKIATELADPGIEYFIAVEDGSLAGYMKLVLSATFEDDEMLDALEVERIYLHTQSMGKGIGRRLMELALHRAIELKKDILFLKAMDSGTDAIEFYKRLGYVICGSLQLPLPTFSRMKKKFRGMVILKRSVA